MVIEDAGDFAPRLLAWHARHGRHDLPWQLPRTPYRVWVSEIMLQQTQVATVIPYFERFMQRLPTLAALAAADEDTVLHLWTGLGYYARARNLHRAARAVVEHHGGELPADPEILATLPGIGRSTAGAICAQAHGLRAPILDGNVKRVLCRLFAIDAEAEAAATLKRLWVLADALTPATQAADYTQAIMDLGATVCARGRPLCALCPVHELCSAAAAGDPQRYPRKRRGRPLPERRCQLLVIRNTRGEVLLEKRPPSGIWGGLWSFPQIEDDADATLACDRILGAAPAAVRRGTAFRHTFSHFHLDATPVFVEAGATRATLMEDGRLTWYHRGSQALGLAAPVQRLIEAIERTGTSNLEIFEP